MGWNRNGWLLNQQQTDHFKLCKFPFRFFNEKIFVYEEHYAEAEAVSECLFVCFRVVE